MFKCIVWAFFLAFRCEVVVGGVGLRAVTVPMDIRLYLTATVAVPLRVWDFKNTAVILWLLRRSPKIASIHMVMAWLGSNQLNEAKSEVR